MQKLQLHANIHNSKFWKCIQCGKCCTLFVFTGVVVTTKEWKLLENDILKLKLSQIVLETCKSQRTLPVIGKKPPKKCAFLKHEKICAIYSKRPKRCREYPLLIHDYGKSIRINISEDCPRSKELLDELLNKPPTWLKIKTKHKKLQIVPFSFFDESMRRYLDEED